MSTLTSVFGMFPLVIFPGAGSRVVQRIRFSSNRRLKLSAILTLLIVPPMLKLFLSKKPKIFDHK